MPRTRRRDPAGLVVAVTGGARGIGLATARAFAAAGSRVAIGDVDGDLAARTGSELGLLGLRVDVSDLDSFTAFLDEVEARLGPVDVLVNNAGIMPIGPLPEEPEQVTQRIVAVNLHGALHGTKLAMARMVPRGRGHIINVSSPTGRFAAPNAATYSATKFAVIGLTQAVRGELRGTGVEASVILPPATATDMVSGLKEAGKVFSPDEVAAVIVKVARKPRFETWIPRSNQRGFKLVQLLPYRWFEALARSTPSSNVFMSQDTATRSAYEDRARS